MSTKSTILLTDSNEHIYHETNEPQYSFNKFIGWNIYFEVAIESIHSFKIKDGVLSIEFRAGQLKDKFKKGISFYGDSVIEVEFDMDGLLIIVKGGSYKAKEIEKIK